MHDFSKWLKIRRGLRMAAMADDYLIVYLNSGAYSKNVRVSTCEMLVHCAHPVFVIEIL